MDEFIEEFGETIVAVLFGMIMISVFSIILGMLA